MRLQVQSDYGKHFAVWQRYGWWFGEIYGDYEIHPMIDYGDYETKLKLSGLCQAKRLLLFLEITLLLFSSLDNCSSGRRSLCLVSLLKFSPLIDPYIALRIAPIVQGYFEQILGCFFELQTHKFYVEGCKAPSTDWL